MAKIAVETESTYKQPDTREVIGSPARYELTRGDGWTVTDVICTAGPHDRVFEEQHSRVCIALVMSGSFQYRSISGRELMTPGSLLLGNAGQYFMCSHEHAMGDRCVAFEYEPQYFECIAEEASVKGRNPRLPLRVPPVKELSTLFARTSAGLSANNKILRGQRRGFTDTDESARPLDENARCSRPSSTDWDAIALELIVRMLAIAGGFRSNPGNLPSAEARTTRVVRMIDSHSNVDHDLVSLAREAKLSPYHFLRMFQQLTSLTPHQYLLRTRLRRAAAKLILESARVIDVALESGFRDLSTFNRGFRREFGVTPRAYRNSARKR